MKIVITQGPDLVAVVDDWRGPIPRAGDYIYHPPRDPGSTPRNVMSVATVTYSMLARPESGSAEHFVGSAEPYIEIGLSN